MRGVRLTTISGVEEKKEDAYTVIALSDLEWRLVFLLTLSNGPCL